MPNNNTEWSCRFPPREDPEIAKINALTHEEIARLSRFAPSSHPWFDSSKPYHDILLKRFKDFGGWNSELSKRIGWGGNKYLD